MLVLTLLIPASPLSAGAISYNDARVEVDGALVIKDTGASLHFQRFTDHLHARQRQDGSNIPKSFYNDLKAASASGVILRFTTSSPAVDIHLREAEFQSRAPQLGVIQNGDNAGLTEFAPGSNPGDFTLAVTSVDPGEPVTYEVVLPSWANADFLGLTLDDGYDLLANPAVDKPIYAAFGDSITHGTGQQSKAYLTYPFLLAERNGWELFNFAIGGSTTTPEIADVLDENFSNAWVGGKPDIITVLWGYNDCHNQAFTPEEFRERYTLFLANVLQHCPEAAIFCIKPTATTSPVGATVNGETKTIEQYRAIVEEVVVGLQQSGYDNLRLIDGEAITSEDELLDGVHFLPVGAETIAEELDLAINGALAAIPSLGDWREQASIATSSLDADDDQDGLANIVEYWLGTDPLMAGQLRPGLFQTTQGQLGVTSLSHRADMPAGLSTMLEGSSNLTQWSPVGASWMRQYIGGGVWSSVVLQTIPLSQGGAPFLRLQVVEN